MADQTTQEYAVQVNEMNKSVELKLCGGLGRNKKHGAHMRAFWASTISFFMAFVGWFALSPVAIEVCTSIEVCENQLFPPVANPKRVAYLKFKAIASGKNTASTARWGATRSQRAARTCRLIPGFRIVTVSHRPPARRMQRSQTVKCVRRSAGSTTSRFSPSASVLQGRIAETQSSRPASHLSVSRLPFV